MQPGMQGYGMQPGMQPGMMSGYGMQPGMGMGMAGMGTGMGYGMQPGMGAMPYGYSETESEPDNKAETE